MSAGSLNIADLLLLLCQHVGIVVMTLDRESDVPGSNPSVSYKTFFFFFHLKKRKYYSLPKISQKIIEFLESIT